MSSITKESDRIWFAQMLRAVAVLGVIFEHYCDLFINRNSLIATLSFAHPVTFESEQILIRFTDWIHSFGFNTGTWGVGLFFLISGFVIPISIERLGSSQFLVRRFFRVYPPYAIGLLLTVVVLYFYASYSGSLFPYTVKDYVINATLVRDWFGIPSIDTVNWTLELEIKFYILCAFLAWFTNLRSPKTLIITTVIMFLFTYFATGSNDHLASTTPLLHQVISTVASAIPYLTFMFIGTSFYNYYAGHWRLHTFLGVTSLLVGLFMLGIIFGFDSAVIFGNLVTFLSAFVVFTVCFIIREKIPYSKALDFVANISYPLYIIHGMNGYVLLNFLVTHNIHIYLAILITFVVMVAASYAFHRIVEMPSNRLGKYVSQNASKLLNNGWLNRSRLDAGNIQQ